MTHPTSPKAHEFRVRVRYAETDKMGVVYHANFFVWMEIGRVELMRSLGFEYKQMELEVDCHLPVVDARCRYKAPARYDDQVIIRTHLKNVRESLIQFQYEAVRASDGTILAEGETTHIVIDADMTRRSLPEKYMTVFKNAVLAHGS